MCPSLVQRPILQIATFCTAVFCQTASSSAQNLSEGKKLFETTCTPCHNFEKGGEPDMYGQTLNLYGVVGRKQLSWRASSIQKICGIRASSGTR
jgi:cytochrome c2